MTKEKKTYVCISYVPLLTADPGTLIPPNMAIERVEKAHHGFVEGCMFIKRKRSLCPVFVTRQAELIHKHLVMWSEDNPYKWFKFQICEHGDQAYSAILFPDVEKSVERFKHAINVQDKNIHRVDIMTLYKPLMFFGPPTAYVKIKDKIPKQNIQVGFFDPMGHKIDRESNQIEDKNNIIANNVHWISVKRSHDKHIDTYVNGIYDRWNQWNDEQIEEQK